MGGNMVIVTRCGWRLAVAVAMIAAASLISVKPAQAIDGGTAVGIGLGSFALGSALGSTAHPYYNPYYYPYGYAYPAPAYYPPAPYYPPRSCWDPYYRSYHAC
jgi:hypothetical protein